VKTLYTIRVSCQFINPNLVNSVNPVRKSSTFQRGGSHGALNPVFALKGIISSSPLQAPIEAELRTGQAAGLSNRVNNGIFDCISRQLRGTRPRPRGMEKKPDNDYESLALPLNHASIYIYLQ
jgi:hypothetical protein